MDGPCLGPFLFIFNYFSGDPPHGFHPLPPYSTNPDDLRDWRGTLADVTAFVQAAGGKDDLTTMMGRLNAASEHLIRTRQRAWDVFLKKCILQNPVVGLSRLDPDKIAYLRLSLPDLIQDDSDLQYERRALADILTQTNPDARAKVSDPRRRDAMDLVQRLALTLDLTIAKYHADLVKLVRAKPKS